MLLNKELKIYSGALKSDIEHLEGASGVAGLIKATLVLEKALIPPNIDFQRINPKVDTEYLSLGIWFPSSPMLTLLTRY